jgi:hypothetical protein
VGENETAQRIEGDIARHVGDLTVQNIILTNQLREANTECSKLGALVQELNARLAKTVAPAAAEGPTS